ncbi:MAG: large-conductance mechanosensitive channel protein MscL [Spirochaetales bacterium]|nr:large-conductance mechanosensitive channel protein MscL [Spirochaetales bacterium]
MKNNGFFAEFKKFISRGNVLDMAVGVVIGGAFTAIVNTLVKDIINPIIGLITGGTDFADLKIILKPAIGETPELAIRYGLFINAIINFLLVALVLFIIIRNFNRMKEIAQAKKKAEEEELKKAEAAKPAEKPADIALLEEIRDLLKK